MKKTFRGVDPIPQILPRIGLGIPENKTKYETNALNWMKACGINVVCHSFDSWLKRTNMQYTIDITDILASSDNCIESGIRFIPGICDLFSTPINPSAPQSEVASSGESTYQYSGLAQSAAIIMIKELKDEISCPSWYLPESLKVGSLTPIIESCDK